MAMLKNQRVSLSNQSKPSGLWPKTRRREDWDREKGLLHHKMMLVKVHDHHIFSYPKPPGNRRCADWNHWKICKLMAIPQLKSGFWLISLNPPQGHKHPKPSQAWLAPSLRVRPSAITSQVNTSHVFFHSRLVLPVLSEDCYVSLGTISTMSAG